MKQPQTRLKGANPLPLQQRVNSFYAYLGFIQSIKKATGLQQSTILIFLAIQHKHYINGKGCSITYLLNTLYTSTAMSLRRSVQYKLDTLVRKGLVRYERKGIAYYYFLTDTSKELFNDLNKGIE